MSQFADGGLFTTKPYLSGSNYIRKMSDYPKGEWCELWDGLFWTFIDDHREFFQSNPRLGMMANQLRRMDPEKLRKHRGNAATILGRLHGTPALS
jgi:deoxyribodipyrimidine photolyase-related protein